MMIALDRIASFFLQSQINLSKRALQLQSQLFSVLPFAIRSALKLASKNKNHFRFKVFENVQSASSSFVRSRWNVKRCRKPSVLSPDDLLQHHFDSHSSRSCLTRFDLDPEFGPKRNKRHKHASLASRAWSVCFDFHFLTLFEFCSWKKSHKLECGTYHSRNRTTIETRNRIRGQK
jgi:hypothetical protein